MLARNPSVAAFRVRDATSAGAFAVPITLGEKLGFRAAPPVGPSGPAYKIWLQDRDAIIAAKAAASQKSARRLGGGGSPSLTDRRRSSSGGPVLSRFDAGGGGSSRAKSRGAEIF